MINESDSERDERYMGIALEEARLAAEEGEVPVGAVVVCGGRVIARAHNQTERLGDATAHAEMLALTAAQNHLGGKALPEATLYITLEPCPMCAGAIGWVRPGRIVWGADDPKRGFSTICRQGCSPLHPKSIVTRGVRAEECAEVMASFFRKLRR